MQKKSKLTDHDILEKLPVKVDYLLLKDRFSHNKSVKKKIFDLCKKGLLFQVRRGQYINIKSKKVDDTPLEVIANSLYYPSYVSLEWALQFYGLILDRVVSVTSVTLRRSCELNTPETTYYYSHLNKKRYPVGYVIQNQDSENCFFIARPEKALLDYISVKAKNLSIENEKDIQFFLEDDLRLYLDDFLNQIKLEDLQELVPYYHRNSKEYRILKWLINKKGVANE